jgi:hypothetical protein
MSNAIMLSVVMLSRVHICVEYHCAQCQYADCCEAEYHYTGCRSAFVFIIVKMRKKKKLFFPKFLNVIKLRQLSIPITIFHRFDEKKLLSLQASLVTFLLFCLAAQLATVSPKKI